MDRQHKRQISLYTASRRSIDYFKGNKKLGAITDGYLTTQRNKVEGLHIANSCDTIVSRDKYGSGNWTPSPAPYLKVMELRQFQAS
ncbi:HAD hydrolase-like protein [Microcoleus sp. S36b_A4]|uniref:hypothetical protein n=1 Tax=Microcoleus sp. S36b_A4 TaxID=3055420 RepID=UPI002FD27C6B